MGAGGCGCPGCAWTAVCSLLVDNLRHKTGYCEGAGWTVMSDTRGLAPQGGEPMGRNLERFQ